MNNPTITEEQFLHDVATHEMHVLMESGVYRHIRFKRPNTSCMHFDLITYPGHLVYSGDMGCFVFQRLHDMFEFFRTDREHKRPGKSLYINTGYWGEKLQAVKGGMHGAAATELDEDRIKGVVNEYRLGWMRDWRHTLGKEGRRELWEAVDDEVLSAGEADEMLRAAYGFTREVAGHTFWFEDFYDHNFTVPTRDFLWCCYALAWGVQKYDAAQVAREAA